MLRIIGDHPFWFGVVTTFVFSSLLWGNIINPQSSAQTRGLGLAMFGGAIALLLYVTRDRGDIFWFFLGGVITLVVSFLVSLKV
jgi:hypothetical protein